MESRKFFWQSASLPACLDLCWMSVGTSLCLCEAYARFLLIFSSHMFYRIVCCLDRLSIFFSFMHSLIHSFMCEYLNGNQCLYTYFMHVWINEWMHYTQCTFCKWYFFVVQSIARWHIYQYAGIAQPKPIAYLYRWCKMVFFWHFPTRKTQQVIRFCKWTRNIAINCAVWSGFCKVLLIYAMRHFASVFLFI